MRKLIFLLFLSPLFLIGQSADCLFEVPLLTGQNIQVNAGGVKYGIYSTETTSIIIMGDSYRSYALNISVDSLVSRSGGEFVAFTDSQTKRRTVISRRFISEVWQEGTKALIISANPRYRWTTVDDFSALQPYFVACLATGGGFVVYSGSNLGTGADVYKETAGGSHRFRTLVGSGSVSIVENANELSIGSNAMDTIPTTSEFNGPITDGVTLSLVDNAVSGNRITDATISTSKIQNDAVDFDKLQNINTGRVLGRSNGGVGSVEQLIIGSGLSLSLGVLSSTGGSGSDTIYYAGTRAWVAATGPGVTFSRAAGVGTFVIPVGVQVFAFGVEGVTAELAGDNSFSIVLDSDASNPYNQGISTMVAHPLQVLNTVNQTPTALLPIIYDEGSSPQRQIIGVGSGDITYRVISLNAYTNWNIIGG